MAEILPEGYKSVSGTGVTQHTMRTRRAMAALSVLSLIGVGSGGLIRIGNGISRRRDEPSEECCRCGADIPPGRPGRQCKPCRGIK